MPEWCPRMRPFLSRPIPLPLMHPLLLREAQNYNVFACERPGVSKLGDIVLLYK
jgi:hypothetical protein